MSLVSSRSVGWHPTTLLTVLALWLATAGNLPLWLAILRLPETQGWGPLLSMAALVGVLWAFTTAFLCLLTWPHWLKPVGVLMLVVVTVSSYFMHSYGVVIDSTMWANTVNTDVREVRDLLSVSMLGACVVGIVLPGWWWWRQPVRSTGARSLALRQTGTAVGALLVAAVLLWMSFQDLASLMRNHKPLRYMINPFNTMYAAARHSLGSAAQAQKPLQPLGEDARLARPGTDPQTSPLIVIVVGETARAANFGLGGYGRDTTPRLKALQAEGQLVYFSDVRSCGTNTHTSVPCMFSHLGREAYMDSKDRYENLLDVLQRAGLAVLWLDNQSGCKGVCERTPNVETRALKHPELCQGGECFDEILLHELPTEWNRLDAERRARGSVVVLHQMGSHGPAYHKRSPAAFKAFQPECTATALQSCDTAHIVNAYDNTLRYTDHVLAETIAWLKAQQRPTALLYVSDHGESLGEKGLYLHGMPYGLAPDEQTHVPMVMWLSSSMQQRLGTSMDCLRQQATKPWSHDHLFHTALGLATVETRVHRSEADIVHPCNAPATGR